LVGRFCKPLHGKRGELQQRYREGQEDQPGALGLMVNMIVLWNTIYNRRRSINYELKVFRFRMRTFAI
jgi:hypothetical protein